MPKIQHLCDQWENTIAKIFKHDRKSELGIMIKEWVVYNKLENFNSLLNCTIDDFTPSGNLCYFKKIVKSCIKHHCKSFSTSDGAYNIFLIKVEMNLRICYVKKIACYKQIGTLSNLLSTINIQ